MAAGRPAGFAVDGPRGPARVAQPGAVWLAQATGNPVLPFHLEADRHWSLRSWDRTQIPKPFSTVALAVGEPFDVPAEAGEAAVEASRVKLDGVEWLYVPDDNTRMLKLQAGEVDAAIFVPFNMVAQLQQNKDIDVHLDPSSREDFLLLNEQHKPLDDVKVRQAICQAIDREAIVKAVLFGNGKVANSFIPGGALYYNPDNPTCKYDPEAAKKLLADAGASNLSFKFLIDSGNSVNDQTAVLIKDNLAKVGINADIVKEESGQEWDTTVAGDYDLSIEYWTNDIIDPDEKATFALYGKDDNRSYYTAYNNPYVTELIDQGRAEMDKDKRTAIYNEIQKIASTEVNWVDLYYSPFRNASRKNVKGFYQNPTGRFMLEDAEITK